MQGRLRLAWAGVGAAWAGVGAAWAGVGAAWAGDGEAWAWESRDSSWDDRGVVITREADLMRALHDEHARALWSYALSLTAGDRGHAEDVVQETLLRAWRNPQVLDQTQGSARGWLLRVAHNIAIDQWRARQVRPEFSTDELPERGEDTTDEVVQSWLVTEAMGRLSFAHRQVLVECYYGGRSTAQAAERIGVPEGTVKSRLHYALAALRLALQEMGVGR